MAKPRRRNEVKLLGVMRRNRPALMMSTALQATVMLVLSLPADAQPASNARPTGGVVVGGSAAISQTANNTTINQSTNRAAIDWKTFNVGSQQSVTFNQPTTSSVTLNRVTGPDPSQIAGRIDANGQVILVNQSGVTFYKGAQVNTNGLMVSAIGMTDKAVQSFAAGGKVALDKPGDPNARVDNQGNITVKQAGLAALVAPQVRNSGTITAKLGHVVLAGAQTATLDLYGDGLLSLDVSNQVTQTPVGPDGKAATALVTNSGVIMADGGTVQLTARAADGVVQNLVQAGGKIRAATMGDHTGTIALNGVGGSIVVEGQLSAAGWTAGTKGGDIEVVSNANVVVASTARINASGKAGGGNIGIGTTLDRVKGGPGVTPAMTAANVTVQQGAQVAANATSKGNGGRVTALSTGTTVMNGTISATGGPMGGDGGFIETSGKGFLFIGPTASVTAAAPNGKAGLWLLDPDSDIDITNATSNVTCTAGLCSPTAANSTLDVATFVTALDGGTSVTVTTSNPAGTQSGNITLDSQIALTTATKDITLVLNAGAGGGAGAITLNQPITDAGSGWALSLILKAGSGITFNNTVQLGGSLTATAGMNAAGNITLGSKGFLQVSGAATFNDNSSNSTMTLHGANAVSQLRGGVAFNNTGSGSTINFSNDGGAAGTVLGTSNVQGTLAVVDTSGSISQSGVLHATGAATFSTTAPNATIDLSTQTNVLSGGVVIATGTHGSASVKNSGGTSLRGLFVGGAFSLEETTGGVSQASTSLQVKGATSFKTDASGKTIVLDDSLNQFSGATSFNTTGSGANVTLVNNVDSSLGASTIGGSLTVNLQNGHKLSLSGTTTTNGGQTYSGGGITLAADTKLQDTGNGAINFSSQSIDGAKVLTLSTGSGGSISLPQIGATTPLASLTVTGPTAITNNIITTGAQAYNSAVALTGSGNSYVLTSNTAGITFAKQITGGSNSLKLTAPSGPIALAGITTSGNLTLTTPGVVTLNSGTYTITGGGSPYVFSDVTTNGTLIFGQDTTFGNVTLGSDTKLDSSSVNANVTFGKIDGAQALVVNAGTGLATFNGAIGSTTPLTSLGVTSDPTINANVTTAGGGQTYNGPITLGASVALTDTGGGAIALNGQVTGGANSLTLSTTGAETLSGVTTTGNLTLGTPSSLTLNAGTYTITGGADPYLFPTVPTTLNGTLTIGMATTFNGAVTLGSDTTVDSSAANAAIDFASTVDGTTAGAQSLTITAGTGTVTLGSTVGGAESLANFSATGGALSLGGAITATGTLALDSTGVGALTLPFNLNGSTVALNSGGTITQTGGIITAGTLVGSAAAATLNKANAISSIGGFNANSGTFQLTDGGLPAGGTLSVTGPLIGNDVTLAGAPTLAVSGSIGATTTVSLNAVEIDLSSTALVTGPTVKLNAGANGITFSGNATIGQSGGIVDINSAGTVSEPASSVIIAGTLESTSGLSGNVMLFGTANAIDNLGNLPLGGTASFALKDANALTVLGTIGAATGQTPTIYLESSAAGGITIGSSGLLKANNASGLISLQTDALQNNGSVVAATVEIAPNTSGSSMTLGGVGGLSLLSSAGFTTGNFVFGAVTVPGSSQTITAGSIAIAGAGFDTTGVSTVTLDATGAVTQTAALTGGSQLQGKASSFTLLNSGNDFSAIALDATAGDVQVVDSAAVILSGNTASANIYFAAPTETLNGVITAGGVLGLQTDSFSRTSGSLTGTTVELAPLTLGTTESLGSGSGLVLSSSAFITGNLRIGAVTIPGSGLTTTAGTIVIGSNFGTSGLALELDSKGGIGEAVGAFLTAGTLTGSAGGTVALINASTIGVIGDFSVTGASSDFQLENTAALTVSGSLSAGRNIYLETANASGISVTGTVAANGSGIAGLQADAISITGTVTAGTVELAPNTAIAVTLGGAGGLSLSQATLSKVGAGTLRIGAATGLGGSLITTSTGISIAGTIDFASVAPTLDLRSTGGVTEAGALLNLGTLTGNTGDIALATGNDSIATVNNYTVTGGGAFTLFQDPSLTLTGTLSAANVNIGTNHSLSVAGSIAAGVISLTGADGVDVTGTVAATVAALLQGATVTLETTANVQGPTVQVQADEIALNGNALLGQAGGTVDLNTFCGCGIFEASTATIIADTLMSSFGSDGDISLLSAHNAIGTIGVFEALSGSFLLKDSSALTILGSLTATGSIYVETSNPGGISIAPGATVAAGSGNLVSFQANRLAIGAGGTVTGGRFEFALDTPGTLTLGTGGSLASLAGVGTASAEIGGVTVPAGGFTVSATAIDTVGTFNGNGLPVAFNTSGAITESAGAPIINIATLTGSAASVTLDQANAISQVGSFGASGNFLLVDSGLAGTLTLAGPLTAANVTISGAPTLSVTGSVSATALDSLSGGAVLLGGGAVVTGSTVALAASGAGGITFTGGAKIGQSGGVVDISSAGTIREPASSIIDAAILQSSGGAGGNVTLLGSANAIASLGNFAVGNGAAFELIDPVDLTIGSGAAVTAGDVTLNANSITLNGLLSGDGVSLFANTGAIAGNGTLIAGSLTGTAAGGLNLSGAGNRISTVNNFTAAGINLNDNTNMVIAGTLNGGSNVTVVDNGALSIGSGGKVTATAIALTASSIALGGTVTDGGAGTVSLVANAGGIGETGTLIAGTLSGGSSGATSLTAANRVARLGSFNASGFSLNDASDLSINGTVNGGPSANIVVNGALAIGGALIANTVSVTASGGITIPGTVQDANSVNLVTTGGTISETGQLIADLLNGSAPGDVSLIGGSNQVKQLGSFSSGGTFTLNDAIDLLITGPLSAPKIVINDGSNAITLANNAVIATGGTARPGGTVSTFPGDNMASTPAGAYLTAGAFTQLGVSTIQGSPSILRINILGPGNIAFDPNAGLQGPNTWLILDMRGGTATGRVNVANLDIIHGGGSGGSNLNGSIDGLTGSTAAGEAGIQPSPSSNFRFNSCPIQSVNCVLLPTQGVPTGNPLNDVSIGTLFNPDESNDLLLPIVSDQDY